MRRPVELISGQTMVSDISEEIWRAVIAQLKFAGWSAQTGGGLDFSWAMLTRDGMKIDMEYDIWRGGEMIFVTLHASKIKGALSASILAQLEMG